jgi:uncharacterized RDD family membrane protein YckC
MARDAVPLRMLAMVIDGVAIFIVVSIIQNLVYATTFFFAPFFFAAAVGFLYFGMLEAMQGQTLGKMALGLKVVKEDMTPISMEQGLIRGGDIFLWFITVGIVALVDLVLALDNGQRLGDRWARTVVIKVQ